MAHNIDMTGDRANMAFLGDRKDIWHELGQAMQKGMTIEQWAKAAGLDWHAVKVPLFAQLLSLGLTEADGTPKRGVKLPEIAIVRSDNGAPLGIATDSYVPHQPQDVLAWFQHYLSVDERFELDTAGSLKGGRIIWAQAKFNGTTLVNGDQHRARLLMTTTFDGTGATINKATMTRVVCNNTLDAALADGGKSIVRTRHNTKFNPERVQKELAAIASGFDQYKLMAEAMAASHMATDETANFFKMVLDVPLNAENKDISSRKLNQLEALSQAYMTTLKEGAKPLTAWAALNAVTRYVDHDRAVQKGDNTPQEARVLSTAFGSGAALKAKAVQLLLGRDGSVIEQEMNAPDAPPPAPPSLLDSVLTSMGH